MLDNPRFMSYLNASVRTDPQRCRIEFAVHGPKCTPKRCFCNMCSSSKINVTEERLETLRSYGQVHFNEKWFEKNPVFSDLKIRHRKVMGLLEATIPQFEIILAQQFPEFVWTFERCFIRNKSASADVLGFALTISDMDDDKTARQFWGPLNDWKIREEKPDPQLDFYISSHIDASNGVISLADQMNCPIGLVYAVFHSYMQVKAWTIQWLCRSEKKQELVPFVAEHLMIVLDPHEIFLEGRQIENEEDLVEAIQDVLDKNVFDILTPTLTFGFHAIFHCIHSLRVHELEKISVRLCEEINEEKKQKKKKTTRKKKRKKKKQKKKNNQQEKTQKLKQIKISPNVDFLTLLKWRHQFLEQRKKFVRNSTN